MLIPLPGSISPVQSFPMICSAVLRSRPIFLLLYSIQPEKKITRLDQPRGQAQHPPAALGLYREATSKE